MLAIRPAASYPPLQKTQGRGTHSLEAGSQNRIERLGHPPDTLVNEFFNNLKSTALAELAEFPKLNFRILSIARAHSRIQPNSLCFHECPLCYRPTKISDLVSEQCLSFKSLGSRQSRCNQETSPISDEIGVVSHDVVRPFVSSY